MSCIQVRWILAGLGMYACSLLFGTRTAMSVAIVAMTRRPDSSPDSPSLSKYGASSAPTHYCAVMGENASSSVSVLFTSALFTHRNDSQDSLPGPEFEWSESLQGIVLGSCFYLFFIVPIFAGRITDTLGGKWITFVGIAFPCLLTALIPVAIRSVGVGAAIALQTLIGGFHGTLYPSLFSLNSKWFPAKERSTANACIIFGASMGNCSMYLLGGYLAETTMGWPLIYYVVSALHLPWLAAWLYFATSDPMDNKRISDSELVYIKCNVERKAPNTRHVKVPWLSIVTSTAVWSSIVCKVPSFLAGIHGVSLTQNGIFSSLAISSSGITCIIAPTLANVLIHRFSVRTIIVRKLFQSISLLGPSLSLLFLTFFECNFTAAIALIFTGLLCYGMLTGGEFSLIPCFAPNHCGSVVGIVNFLPFSMGIVAPYLVGIILDSTVTGETLNDKWNLIFYITSALYVFGWIFFVIFATDQQQEWDKGKAEETIEEGSPVPEKGCKGDRSP